MLQKIVKKSVYWSSHGRRPMLGLCCEINRREAERKRKKFVIGKMYLTVEALMEAEARRK
jgi:hypothetical protein